MLDTVSFPVRYMPSWWLTDQRLIIKDTCWASLFLFILPMPSVADIGHTHSGEVEFRESCLQIREEPCVEKGDGRV